MLVWAVGHAGQTSQERNFWRPQKPQNACHRYSVVGCSCSCQGNVAHEPNWIMLLKTSLLFFTRSDVRCNIADSQHVIDHVSDITIHALFQDLARNPCLLGLDLMQSGIGGTGACACLLWNKCSWNDFKWLHYKSQVDFRFIYHLKTLLCVIIIQRMCCDAQNLVMIPCTSHTKYVCGPTPC